MLYRSPRVVHGGGFAAEEKEKSRTRRPRTAKSLLLTYSATKGALEGCVDEGVKVRPSAVGRRPAHNSERRWCSQWYPSPLGTPPISTCTVLARGGKASQTKSFIPDPAQVIIVQGDSFTGVPTSLPSEQNLGWGGINNPKVSRCRSVGNKPAILPWAQASDI